MHIVEFVIDGALTITIVTACIVRDYGTSPSHLCRMRAFYGVQIRI